MTRPSKKIQKQYHFCRISAGGGGGQSCEPILDVTSLKTPIGLGRLNRISLFTAFMDVTSNNKYLEFADKVLSAYDMTCVIVMLLYFYI